MMTIWRKRIYTRQSDGMSAEWDWCAGGSFAQVVIRNAQGDRISSRTHRFSSAAEAQIREFLAE